MADVTKRVRFTVERLRSPEGQAVLGDVSSYLSAGVNGVVKPVKPGRLFIIKLRSSPMTGSVRDDVVGDVY